MRRIISITKRAFGAIKQNLCSHYWMRGLNHPMLQADERGDVWFCYKCDKKKYMPVDKELTRATCGDWSHRKLWEETAVS